MLDTLDLSLRRNFRFLFGTGVLFWSSTAAMLPVLPLYVKDAGGTEQQVGLVMGALAVGLLLSRVWVTRMTDQRGRQFVLLLGLAIALLAPIGYALVPSIPGLMALRAFHGISIAAFSTAFGALVVDLAPERRRGEWVGYMSLVNPLGLGLGPVLGGFVKGWAGYTWIFFAATGVALLGMICCAQIQQPQWPRAKKTTPGASFFWQTLTQRPVLIPTFVMLMIGMAFGAVSTFVPLYIEDAHVGLNAGFFYSAVAVASFGARFWTGRASDRYGRGLFISGSLVLYAMAMLILWTAHSPAAFLVAGAVEGLASGALFPMVISLAADRAQPDTRVRNLSLCLGGFDLGMAIAGPVLGTLASQLGIRGLFGCAFGLALLALVAFVTQSFQGLSPSLEFALGRTKDRYALPDVRAAG
ncbi:MFS transporter [Anthocerotibacter panamensis]|uniref:MFS transporter n=1 Tax=Anthocerotibacter panamensis TaxID=2857077 RepID=UPI001C4040F9|nr:MFS transporter [Anthocerotibacter panamensis]